MISLSSKSGAFGSDYGLNMLSQGSFAEMILYSYATFQMLASSIPMLSWSVINACAHATANLASQFSPIQVASSLGSNIVDNNLSMDNYSIGNRTISQQNLAPSLDMTDSIINYGSHKIIIGNNGEQFVIQTVHSLETNFRSSALLQTGYQNQFVSSQSMLNSLTQKEANLISTGNSMAIDIGRRLTHDEALSIGLTESEYQALQIVSSDSESFSQHTGSSHRKTSGTNVEVGSGMLIIKGGVSGGNTEEETQGNLANQQQSHSEALSKIQSAVQEGKFSSTNSEVQSLSKNLNANLSEQQSIGQEIAKTKQEMEQLSYSMNYVFQNSITIDRNINELVLNEIIAQNPEIRSKEQAARWAKDHSAEAEKIAFEVAQINNEIPKDLNNHINDGNFLHEQDLQSNFYDNVKKLKTKAQTINLNDSSNEMHSQNIEHTFSDNEKIKNLDRISDSIKNKTQEIQKKFSDTTDSTFLMAGKQALENLGITKKDKS
ncbi:putative conjugative transfer TraG domain protein [Orientia tsutsugamushi str. Gilliam]|nr:putative conjugative transfer TraG domain protein [Orientia tsutsugamushi str. Gilliam]